MKTTLKILLLLIVCSPLLFAQKFYFGAAYYPEQVTPKQFEQDVRFMKKAGVNLLRIGDFAWYNMQPTPNTYQFDWLKNAVNLLGIDSIQTLLCTPTAAIPKWLFDKHPDIMQVTAAGDCKPYGKRRHACLNNLTFQMYSKNIATNLAKAFVGNKNVVGFQIDNELGAEDPYCYCEICRTKFSKWLHGKYQTVENLNNVWGLTFWSERLNSFNEVWLPRKGDNPSVFQDYQTFTSDCIIDYFNLQKEAIRAVLPDAKITHNICSSGFLYAIDLYKFAQSASFLSLDNYPYTWTLENEYGNKNVTPYSPSMASLALSQIRGSNDTPFWVTEAQIGRTAGLQRNLIQPGIVRLWSHQEFSHGANGILFFAWKTFSSAHEHLMAGVMETDNIPRRKFDEVKQAGQEIKQTFNKIGQLMPSAKAAIIRDFHCDWAFEDGRFSGDFRYMREVHSYYSALRHQSVTTDIVNSENDFSKYDLIIVPSQVVITPQFTKNIEAAARRGATIVLTCMTGLRDSNIRNLGTFVDSTLLSISGIEIEEQHSLTSQKSANFRFDEKIVGCGLWFDVIKLKSAKPLGFYSNQFFVNKPAITLNQYGLGNVIYVGTIPEQDAVEEIVKKAVSISHIKPIVLSSNPLVEVTEVKSTKTNKKYVYVLNYSDSAQKVTLNRPLLEFNSGVKLVKEVEIPAMDYKLFCE
ncbi:MAG: beta-galactosidase [Bacteroidales bacterium]